MCIIIYKPEGVKSPTEKVLSKCLSVHKDGFGVMYRHSNKIAIIKGLYKIEQINKIVSRIPIDSEACFHFRMATHGNVSAGNCHPFPLSSKNDALTKNVGLFDSGVVHNGIISGFGYRNDSSLSDTMNLIKYISTHTRVYNTKSIGRFIKPHYGKFIVMTPEWTYYWGDFIKDGGLSYSNTTYKDYSHPKTYKTYAKTKLPFVDIVDPKEVEMFGSCASYNGMFGTVSEFCGVTIFAEYDCTNDDIDYLKDEIEMALAEGEIIPCK